MTEKTLDNLVLQMYKNWFSSFEQIFESLNLNPEPFFHYFEYHKKQSQSFNLQDIQALKENLVVERKAYLNSKLNLFIGASTVLITPLPEIIYSLLLQIPINCRISDPLLLPFYEKFKNLAPIELKDFFAFEYWSSNDRELTKQKIKSADCLIIHGSDQTIKQITELKTENQIVLGFGHKISFMLCSFNQDFQDNLANYINLIAQDLFAFLQKGCLSAQVIYVLADQESEILDFCYKLNNELEKFNWQMQASVAFEKFHFIEKTIINQNNKLIGNHIIYSTNQAFEYMPINGMVWVKPLKDKNLETLDFMPDFLINKIACIGHNLPENEIKKIQNKLNYDFRQCDLGFMQKTCLFWLQKPSEN